MCIFAGERTPFVLRPTEQEENHYTVIGECFIYSRMQAGFLEGEFIEDITIV